MKNVFTVFLISFLILINSNEVLCQSYFYVSSSGGSDTNSGLTPSYAWQTLVRVNQGIDSEEINSSDFILFKNGDTWKNQSLDLTKDTSSPEYLTITTYTDDLNKAIFDGNSLNNIGITIKSKGIKIENIEIRNYQKDGINADVGNNNDLSIVIDNVYVHHNGSVNDGELNFGIYLAGSNSIIRNSIIELNRNDGVFSQGNSLLIDNNYFDRNGTESAIGDQLQIKNTNVFTISNMRFNHFDNDKGIIQARFDSNHNGIFEYNTIDGNNLAYYGINMGGDGKIRFNRISNIIGGAGIRLPGNKNEVYSNLIENCKDGISIDRFNDQPHEIYNNTLVDCFYSGMKLGSTTQVNVIAKNNIIYSNLDGSFSLFISEETSSYEGDNNLFYSDKFYRGDITYNSLSDWQAELFFDLNSINSNPLFQNSGSDPYSLSASSLAINNGQTLAPEFAKDILGNVRGLYGNWGIGAYEYVGANKIININHTVLNSFVLTQNYPNPFNPATTINFSLAADSKVSLKIFDVIGQEVAQLVNGQLAAGQHNVNFDASSLNSGVYFYKIEANGVDGTSYSSVKKMILTK